MNQKDPIVWISIPSCVQDEGGTAFDPRFVQHCFFYCQQCVQWYCSEVHRAQCMQCTVHSGQWSDKALFLWDEPVFLWDEPSSALKGLPTPKGADDDQGKRDYHVDDFRTFLGWLHLHIASKQMMIMMAWLWKITRLRKAENMQIVTTKPHRIALFILYCGAPSQLRPTRCMECFFDMWPGNVVILYVI